MTTLLPTDADNNVIPALRLADGRAHNISATAIATRNNVPFSDETTIISLYATVPVYIKFGDATVTATTNDHYFPANFYYDIAITAGSGKTAHDAYLSVLKTDDDGVVYVSEKE